MTGVQRRNSCSPMSSEAELDDTLGIPGDLVHVWLKDRGLMLKKKQKAVVGDSRGYVPAGKESRIPVGCPLARISHRFVEISRVSEEIASIFNGLRNFLRRAPS